LIAKEGHIMTRQHKQVEQLLRAKASQLTPVPTHRNAIAVEIAPELVEQGRLDAERDLAIQHADRESRLLREVEGALQRLKDGTYGICIECDEPIADKRLAAVAWASRCLHCQQQADPKPVRSHFGLQAFAA
jgi:DnaK suppressor protein